MEAFGVDELSIGCDEVKSFLGRRVLHPCLPPALREEADPARPTLLVHNVVGRHPLDVTLDNTSTLDYARCDHL